jgi:hypothetical protein
MWMRISLLDICIRVVFLLSSSMRLLSVIIIRYPQIGIGPTLNIFKNSFAQFLVFWACFENIMQHQKYVEPKKNKIKLWIRLQNIHSNQCSCKTLLYIYIYIFCT